jgi:hypothetical protein
MNLPHPNLIFHPALLHTLLLYVQDRLIEVFLWFTEFARDGERPCDIRGVVRVFAPSVEEKEFAGSKELVVLCVVDDTGIGAVSPEYSKSHHVKFVRPDL